MPGNARTLALIAKAATKLERLDPDYADQMRTNRESRRAAQRPERARPAILIDVAPRARRGFPTPCVITFEGKSLTIAQWAAEIGMNERTLRNRLRAGLTLKQAIEKPVMRGADVALRNELARGRVKTLKETVQTSGGASRETAPKQAFFLEAAE